jgi:hypothetical protein
MTTRIRRSWKAPYLALLAVSPLLAGCPRLQPEASQEGAAAPAAAEAYAPGLGELMAAQQVRHAKLWFAGEAGNWPLAAYEVDELKEGFEDVVKLHPEQGETKIPVAQLVPVYMNVPIRDLAAAVAAHDRARFEIAFDALTAACNTCHRAAEHGFNVLQRPTAPPFTNQQFAPAQ